MRRTFLFKGLIFLCCFLLMFWGLAWADGALRLDEELYAQKERLDSAGEVSVMFLGDSLAYSGIDASQLPPDWLIFAYPGDNLRDVYAKIRYAAETKGITAAVIGIGYHQLSTYRMPNRNTCATLRMLPPQEIGSVYGMSLGQLLRTYGECAVPLLSKPVREKFMIVLLEQLRERIKAYRNGIAISGVLTPDLAVTPTENGVLGGELASQMGENTAEPELVQTLADILTYGRAHGIQIVLVRFPLSTLYLEGLTSYNFAPYEQALENHPPDALLDFSREYVSDQLVFRDISHLNAEGAQRFTSVLLQALQQALMLPASPPSR
jgi:hypothetical protein